MTAKAPEIVKPARLFLIASWLLLVAGCATEQAVEKKTGRVTPTIAMTGASGDMNKYIGTWTSNCGKTYKATSSGGTALTSGINSFSFTSVSGSAVEGTLAIDSHETPDCSGPYSRTSAKITMSYVGNITVRSSLGESTLFTGTADKVAATAASGGGNAFNIGFFEGFNRFQLAPLDNFSTTNLVYTKKQ
ncbi:MAG: hypothetical protein JWM42_3627 [Burkholderia sp.]|nr:hypothetical protein [Burkholderia sp.]